MEIKHQPVLLAETLELLQPERGGLFIDATLGMGGHSQAMLERAGRKPINILGIDQDEQALDLAQQRLGNAINYAQGNFSNLENIYRQSQFKSVPVQGILMDLGVSSFQIDTPERGFSFSQEGPLDMRMDQEAGPTQLTAAEVLNTYPEPKLADIFYQYGEERFGRKIARAIVQDRQKTAFTDTRQLADLIFRLYPAGLRYKHPHPATKVFQALRIEVNQELQNLEKGLAAALSVLGPGGRLAVISFHSLEDRIVKRAFKEASMSNDFQLLLKKPLTASSEELAENPRSRSAKLRGLLKVA